RDGEVLERLATDAELPRGDADNERPAVVRPDDAAVSRVERCGRLPEGVEGSTPDEAALPRLAAMVLKHEPDKHRHRGDPARDGRDEPRGAMARSGLSGSDERVRTARLDAAVAGADERRVGDGPVAGVQEATRVRLVPDRDEPDEAERRVGARVARAECLGE